MVMADMLDKLDEKLSLLSVKKKINWLGIAGLLFGMVTTAFNGVVYLARMPSGPQFETLKNDTAKEVGNLKSEVGTLQQSVTQVRDNQAATAKDQNEKLDKLLSRRR